MSESAKPDQQTLLFHELVYMYQMGAMQSMGKIMNPVSGEIERNLDQARHAIDMLAMLESRTEGNRNEAETRTLRHVLAELRMNYVDEKNSPEPPAEPDTEAKPQAEADSESGADAVATEPQTTDGATVAEAKDEDEPEAADESSSTPVDKGTPPE